MGKHFPPEFLGRFDELILFRSLSQADLRAIIDLRLDETLARLKEQGIQVDFDREVLIDFLLEKLRGAAQGCTTCD